MAEHGITAMEELVSILPPDGEAWGSVSARALYCVRKWLDQLPQANILFVCQDAVMQSLAEALCGRWFDNRHGTSFRFARTGDGWGVEEVGWPHRRPCVAGTHNHRSWLLRKSSTALPHREHNAVWGPGRASLARDDD
jgi:broad specificity phosphatase PhoE